MALSQKATVKQGATTIHEDSAAYNYGLNR